MRFFDFLKMHLLIKGKKQKKKKKKKKADNQFDKTLRVFDLLPIFLFITS